MWGKIIVIRPHAIMFNARALEAVLDYLLQYECECDLDQPCLRCRVLNEFYPGAASAEGVRVQEPQEVTDGSE